MNLSVKDAARLLAVSEKTIYRWIKQELVPAYKMHESYRFNRAELLEWATSRRLGVDPAAFAAHDLDALPLPRFSAALEEGGVYYRIEGADRDEVLAQVVEHLRLPAEVDRDYLRKVLIAREELASTAIGGGIALPHPRNPGLLHVTRPTATLCFLENPVDFRALDAQPVQALFVLIAPTLRAHLHLLSRLGFLLQDRRVRQALERQESRDTIFTALRRAEERMPR